MSKIRVFLCLALWLAAMDAVMAQERYQVGVCDWMVLKRQKLGAFELAKQLGCDGLEMDMGSLGQRDTFENKLRIPKEAALFKKTADSLGIQVGAVAMSGFYAQDLTKKDTYLSLAEDCFDTMDKMGGVTVAFLPLGGCGNDWTTNKAKRAIIVKRLHEIGEAAKSRGKRVGIDTPLDAKGNLRLLKEIHSDGIGIFYKFQTIIENGWDLCKDMARLGSKNICAIHASNTDKVWLREDSCVNLPAIKQTLDQMGWSGWLFVERSRSTKMVRNVKMNYGNNVRYLKEVFNSYPAPAVTLQSEGRDPGYVKTIIGRAEKATDELSITWTPMGENVRNIIANRYFALNDIYAERDSLKKIDKALAAAQCDARLYRSHFGFDADLSRYLKPQEVERVKDVMTFDVVKVTYDAYCDMIPSLTTEEKAQILLWLKEGRELAIDAESSNKKHETFKKYKGRINNYLSQRGYDIQKEREAWEQRLKTQTKK